MSNCERKLFELMDDLNKFWADYDNEKKKAYLNDVIDGVNKHNDRCMEVYNKLTKEADPSKFQCYMTMMEGNLSTSIKWCCIMREAGLDACVDMLTCCVIPKCEVEDYDEMIAGKRRYNSFCHAEKD